MSKRRKTTNRFSWTFLLIVLVAFSHCENSTPSITEAEKTQLIKNSDQFLNDWHIAAAEANYQNYFGKMDSISIFIGTDATENWDKTAFEAFSKPYFDKGKAWSFSALERNIYTNKTGSFIWFDELLDTWMGICRGSGVIENNNGNLKIKHYVLSVTVPNDDIQGLLALKKEKDSILTRQLKNLVDP